MVVGLVDRWAGIIEDSLGKRWMKCDEGYSWVYGEGGEYWPLWWDLEVESRGLECRRRLTGIDYQSGELSLVEGVPDLRMVDE